MFPYKKTPMHWCVHCIGVWLFTASFSSWCVQNNCRLWAFSSQLLIEIPESKIDSWVNLTETWQRYDSGSDTSVCTLLSAVTHHGNNTPQHAHSDRCAAPHSSNICHLSPVNQKLWVCLRNHIPLSSDLIPRIETHTSHPGVCLIRIWTVAQISDTFTAQWSLLLRCFYKVYIRSNVCIMVLLVQYVFATFLNELFAVIQMQKCHSKNAFEHHDLSRLTL